MLLALASTIGRGPAKAAETPIGFVPASGAIDLAGLTVTQGAMNDLLTVDAEAWLAELEEQEAFFGSLGSRLPPAIQEEALALEKRLGGGGVPANGAALKAPAG